MSILNQLTPYATWENDDTNGSLHLADKILLYLIKSNPRTDDSGLADTIGEPLFAVRACLKLIEHDGPELVQLQVLANKTTKVIVHDDIAIRAFLKEGGFTRIIFLKEEAQKKQEEKARLELEKLKYDVRNSKRIFRTYWFTFGMAVFATLLSIFLLYLKLKGR